MNKTIKKILIICVCIVLFLVFAAVFFFAGAWWYSDMTKILAAPSNEILKIAANDHLTNGICAYSITQYENKIVVTHYATKYLIKLVYTYNLENNVITDKFIEAHYETKLQAKTSKAKYPNKKINDNIITAKVKSDLTGKNVQDLYDIYSNYDIPKIEEIK